MFVTDFGHHKKFKIYTQTFEWESFDGMHLGARCHLFNRTQLCQRFALMDDASTSNLKIIWLLYRKYGLAFAEQLLGEYALVLWDNLQHRLICVTDHFNNLGIFYSKHKDTFYLSDEPLILQSLPEIGKKINFRKIAMGHCFTAVHEPGETYFENIHFVPAASILCVSNHFVVSIEQYWAPDLRPVQHFKHVEDFSSAFKEMFSQVIQSYTEHDPVISLLSGGLDSSAITAMAADVLSKKNKQLMSFSSALAEGSEGYDEREYINQIKAPNLNKQFITDEMRGPFDALETFLYSPVITSRHYLYRAFNAKAREYGAKIILDGCFGEMGPSYWGDERLAELLQKGQWLGLIQQSRAHHQLFQRSFKSMMLQDMILPNLPVSW